jgi:hypothetical protein
MHQMYNFVELIDSLFCRAIMIMCRLRYFVYGSCRMRHFCIAIILYVIPNHLDVVISSDVICMSNFI